MNLKVPGAILPLGCAILSTRAITVRGGGLVQPPLGELGLKSLCLKTTATLVKLQPVSFSYTERMLSFLFPVNKNINKMNSFFSK